MATIGTRLYTWLFGEKVGEDEFGNRYYRSTREEGLHIGRGNRERRWVIYKGLPEPSKVPPAWHGWLHHTQVDPPAGTSEKPEHRWEKPHLPNLTGTALAYRPTGHMYRGGKRNKATGDYEAWSPNKGLEFKE